MALIVHHLANSRSQRILWLLEELGVDYEVRRYERDSVTNLAPPELAAIHPLGKSPLIEVDGQLIAESGAIVEYICSAFGGEAWQIGSADHAYIRYLEFLHFAEGSAMTPILLNLYAGRLGDAAAPLMPRIQQQLSSHFSYMDEILADTGHFAGADWTAADVMMSFPAEIAVLSFGETYPNISAFVQSVHQRPAWQRARERGGAYYIF
jgi:glutathione S-transferase